MKLHRRQRTFTRTRIMCLAYSGAAALAIGAAMAQQAPSPATPPAPPPSTAPAERPATSEAEALVLFDSAEDAAVALVDAVRGRDRDALRALLGPSFDRLAAGDLDVHDEDLQRFTAAYDARSTLIDHGNGTYTLAIGQQEWEFPAPIVSLNGKFWFDGEQGVEEVLNRVIGEHELQTIAVCRRYPAMQQVYFELDPDGDGVKSYAMKLKSSEGKRDGLYWPDAPGAPQSPIGLAVAAAIASREVSADASKPEPYNGYHYRILTRQGPGASGGEMDYIDADGRMTRGFALLAWPASYGNSGITSFIVAQDGVVYQRDLGEATSDEAAKITAYDPTDWTRVGADGLPETPADEDLVDDEIANDETPETDGP